MACEARREKSAKGSQELLAGGLWGCGEVLVPRPLELLTGACLWDILPGEGAALWAWDQVPAVTSQ